MESDSPPEPQTLTFNLETLTLCGDPPSDQFASLNDLSHELASLHELAVRGSWRSVLDKVSSARSVSLLQKPHDQVMYLSYNALALLKLRRFSDASAELDSLDDLDKGSHYRYESYPNVYPNRTGSMIPFSLRWFRAVVPIKLGRRQDGLDGLYSLLDFVRNMVIEKENGKDLSLSARVWRKREFLVTNSIIGVHLSNKEFSVCLNLIEELLNRGFLDPILLSKLGYIQMKVGDLEGAKRSFNRVEGLMEKEKSDWALSEIQFKNLVNRNKALVYLVEKDYFSAVREYEKCIERDQSDVVAINNKALCLMYSRDLSVSIKVLENALERVPTVALNETLVVNLCSMYELAYVNHSDIKRTLSNWIARVASDDFDSSCTRI